MSNLIKLSCIHTRIKSNLLNEVHNFRYRKLVIVCKFWIGRAIWRTSKQDVYTSFNKFSLSTVPFTLIGACMDQWSYAEPTNTLDRLNMMPKPKCLWLNKTYIYIADCTQIYLGEIIIIFDDICCSDYWPLSTTFTCSSTFPLLGGGARIT